MNQNDPHFIIVGCGKMAKLIAARCAGNGLSFTPIEQLPFPAEAPPNSVVFHVGSGRLFTETLEFCEKSAVPIIQASSSGVTLPPADGINVTIIDAPNLGLAIAAHLKAFEEQLGPMMRAIGAKSEVRESHQASKTSAPITAQKFALSLGLQKEDVVSIRDTAYQLEKLDVPAEYLDGHAYHFIDMEAGGIKISTVIKIHGRDPYFWGGLIVGRKLIEMKSRNELMPGIEPVAAFMF